MIYADWVHNRIDDIIVLWEDEYTKLTRGNAKTGTVIVKGLPPFGVDDFAFAARTCNEITQRTKEITSD